MKVEFHCHSIYSQDSVAKPEKMLVRAKQLGLSKFMLTDHNTTRGAMKLAEIAPEVVVVGEEIEVVKDGKFLGEVIGYFMKEEIPSGLEVEVVFKRLQEQAAFINIPHPFDQRRSHWTDELLLEYQDVIDAIEVFNSRSMTRSANQRAIEFAQKNDWMCLNGSDAHSCFELGWSSVELPEFGDAETLRSAIHDAKLINRISSPSVHLISRIAVIQHRLSSKS